FSMGDGSRPKERPRLEPVSRSQEISRGMDMKFGMVAAAAVAGLIAAPALAQGDGTLPQGPKPAIKSSKTEPAMPVPGKTSFTADQAREHMAKRGYNIVSSPLKDDNGIWYA